MRSKGSNRLVSHRIRQAFLWRCDLPHLLGESLVLPIAGGEPRCLLGVLFAGHDLAGTALALPVVLAVMELVGKPLEGDGGSARRERWRRSLGADFVLHPRSRCWKPRADLGT